MCRCRSTPARPTIGTRRISFVSLSQHKSDVSDLCNPSVPISGKPEIGWRGWRAPQTSLRSLRKLDCVRAGSGRTDSVRPAPPHPNPLPTGEREKKRRERFAEFPIALEMPLPAHGLRTRAEFLGVQQNPDPPARRARAGAAIVLRQAALNVGGPADVSQAAARRLAAEDIDEAGHPAIMPDSRKARANIPVVVSAQAGTTVTPATPPPPLS